MRWIIKKKKAKSLDKAPFIKDEGKVLDRIDANKVKGGTSKKSRIWNGCGGIIPQ